MLLGQKTFYPKEYNPDLLDPIQRVNNITGYDTWVCYELSWINAKTKTPQVAIVVFTFSSKSEFILESKSVKLYLNSLNQTEFSSVDDVLCIISEDFKAKIGCDFSIEIYELKSYDVKYPIFIPKSDFICIDDFSINEKFDDRSSKVLDHEKKLQIVRAYSDIFSSRCPVTDQPDWASIYIEFASGESLDFASFRDELKSFRVKNGFHETCIDEIFLSLKAKLKPQMLVVLGKFTRRGGIEINPLRYKAKGDYKKNSFLLNNNFRAVRQ